MADLRIFSYLPNPRLYKATIAARFSGAEIEIVGAKPKELARWLWDYDARALSDDERADYAQFARKATTGFGGELYKTDAFLAANPFGNVPAAFGDAGRVGIFESNSIMRAAARLGPNGAALCGRDALSQSRIDGFLDQSLIFARDLQRYLFAARDRTPVGIHAEMTSSVDIYLSGIEQALAGSKYIACDELTLADIAFACELCLFSNEMFMADALQSAGLKPLMPRISEHPRLRSHLQLLSEHPHFAEDLGRYFETLLSV